MKNKTFGIIFWISIGLGFLMFISLIWISLEYQRDNLFLKNENWGLELQNRTYKKRLQECKKYPLFEQVVSETESWRYDLKNYNCVDFSKDLVRKLEEIGIKSNIAISKDRTHAWVVVFVEATTGNFINPKSELEILEIRNSDSEVVCSYK